MNLSIANSIVGLDSAAYVAMGSARRTQVFFDRNPKIPPPS